MVHFGILCPAATGHLNPMAALGYELQQRGHRVTVIGIEDVKSKVLAAGLGFEVIGLLDYPLGTSKKIFTKIGNLSGLEALRMTIEATADGAKANFRDTPKVIEAARIEFLLVDQATPEGGTIAEYMNIPFITVCNALMINRDSTVPPFASDWNYNPSQWGIIRNQIGYSVLLWMGRSLIGLNRVGVVLMK